MSTAHKCDRCGTWYDRQAGDLTIDLHEAVKPDDKMATAVGSDDLLDRSTEGIDFCSTCSKTMRAWMGKAFP